MAALVRGLHGLGAPASLAWPLAAPATADCTTLLRWFALARSVTAGRSALRLRGGSLITLDPVGRLRAEAEKKPKKITPCVTRPHYFPHGEFPTRSKSCACDFCRRALEVEPREPPRVGPVLAALRSAARTMVAQDRANAANDPELMQGDVAFITTLPSKEGSGAGVAPRPLPSLPPVAAPSPSPSASFSSSVSVLRRWE